MEHTSQPPDRPDISPEAESPAEDRRAAADRGMHLTTFTYQERFWEVYVEFADDEAPESSRARLCFIATDKDAAEEPVRTAVVLIEPSRREVWEAARAFDRYHLTAMLRSVL